MSVAIFHITLIIADIDMVTMTGMAITAVMATLTVMDIMV